MQIDEMLSADVQAKGLPARPGKVPLEKGYSQLDWMRVSKNEDMAGAHTPITSMQHKLQLHA